MADAFPLMPVPTGGPAAPIEGATNSAPTADQHPYEGGIADTFKTNYYNSPVVTALSRGLGEAQNPAPISHDDAAQMLTAQGLDPAFLAKDGNTVGGVQAEAQRQSEIKLHQLRQDREGNNWSSRPLTQLGGAVTAGMVDPSNLVLGPAAAELGGMARGGLAARAAIGAGAGVAYNTGMQVGAGFESGHDPDLMSWQFLRDTTLSAGAGGLLHSAFGPRPATRIPASDSFSAAVNFTMGQEGGLANDTGGVTKFGISQKAHPGLDITKLTPADAGSIYHNEYWKAIDGDNIHDPKLAAAAFDAAVNQGPSNANKWLAESGGDVSKYLDLREQHYRELAASDPEKYGKYLNGWLLRLTSFRVQMMGQLPVRGEFTGPLSEFPHTGPEAGPHSDISTQQLNDEYMRRYGGATSPVPYSDDQMAVMRVMSGPSELVPPAFSDEYMQRHGGEAWPVLPKIEQRGPASPVSPDYYASLQQAGQRWGAGWDDRMAAGAVALKQFEADNEVDPGIAFTKRSALTIPGEHDDQVRTLESEALQRAQPNPLRYDLKDGDADALAQVQTEAEQAPKPVEENNLNDYATQADMLREGAGEGVKDAAAAATNAHEEGTQMTHDELTKAVQSAVQCGVAKGISYGA